MPLWMHVCLNFIILAGSEAYWVVPLILSFRAASNIDDWDFTNYEWTLWPLCIYGPLLLVFSCFSVGLVICFKWAVIGLRKPGSYNWDESSYCQRWQIYIVFEKLNKTGLGSRGVLEFLNGTPYIVWYFRAMGAKIGKNCCLYPFEGDPIMTEPDCVEMADNVCVGNASLIAHINTRGEFKLNTLKVASGCVLRDCSRLLSGAAMETRSMLLEHTLIMSGDVTERNSVWQGWPGELIGFLNFDEDEERAPYESPLFSFKRPDFYQTI
jgi:hypothetical protein